jgi:hypothetical protein
LVSKRPSWPSIATVVAVLRLLGLRDFNGIDLFAREAMRGFYAEEGWNREEVVQWWLNGANWRHASIAVSRSRPSERFSRP